MRVPVYMAHASSEHLADMVNEEVMILQTLQQLGFRWSPRLIAFDVTSDNALGLPYVISEWVHGKPLKWSEVEPKQQDSRDKIVRQIMQIILELARCTVYSRVAVIKFSLSCTEIAL